MAELDLASQLATIVLSKTFNEGRHLIYLNESFWHYEKTHWRECKDAWVRGRVIEAIPALGLTSPPNSVRLSKDALEILKAIRAKKDDELRLHTEPLPVINCSNGELWLDFDGSVEFREHKPESYLRAVLPVEYNRKAKCERYDAAVAEIFSKAKDTSRMIRSWHELTGYIIQPSRQQALIPVLFGAGNNGKTSLITTVTKLLGSDQVASGRVEELEKNQFSLISLLGKYIYIDDDVSADVHLDDGLLKKLSEGKVLTAERKYHDAMTFAYRAVPVLLCNNVPSLSDVSPGMLRRLRVIPFDRAFTSDEANADLFIDIWEKELPGILNQALAGWKRLKKRGRIKWSNDVDSSTNDWVKLANPIRGFVSEECKKNSDSRCLLATFYRAFCVWLRNMGLPVSEADRSVKKKLEHLGFKVKKSNQGITIFGLRLRGTSKDPKKATQ